LAIKTVETIIYSELPPLDEKTAHAMNHEFKISLLLSIIYFAFLLSVTILNFTAPGFMKTILWGGMTVTWFATALGAMIMASLIAWLHVRYYQKKLALANQQREVA
jgi:formate/nitrite transporter FocA (FNT family)